MIKPNFQAPYCPLEGDEYVNRCRQKECGWWDRDIGACAVHKIAAALAALTKEDD